MQPLCASSPQPAWRNTVKAKKVYLLTAEILTTETAAIRTNFAAESVSQI